MGNNKKYTIEDLRNGEVFVVNDGSLEELRKVIKLAFPDDDEVPSGRSIFYGTYTGTVYWTSYTDVKFYDKPTQSAKDFLDSDAPKNDNFESNVSDVLDQIKQMLISKNKKYGNSALQPSNIFSKLSAKEGLLVRIDDKLKRIANGSYQNDDEDVINDLMGYLVLLKIIDKFDF
jgi:hypothetical protein